MAGLRWVPAKRYQPQARCPAAAVLGLAAVAVPARAPALALVRAHPIGSTPARLEALAPAGLTAARVREKVPALAPALNVVPAHLPGRALTVAGKIPLAVAPRVQAGTKIRMAEEGWPSVP